MTTLKIETNDFLDWYYNSGSDQEQGEIALDLGRRIIEGLYEGGVTITPELILEECHQDVIPLHLVEGYETFDEEIGDVFTEYEVVLI